MEVLLLPPGQCCVLVLLVRPWMSLHSRLLVVVVELVGTVVQKVFVEKVRFPRLRFVPKW